MSENKPVLAVDFVIDKLTLTERLCWDGVCDLIPQTFKPMGYDEKIYRALWDAYESGISDVFQFGLHGRVSQRIDKSPFNGVIFHGEWEMPSDLAALQKENAELRAKVEELEEQVENRNAELQHAYDNGRRYEQRLKSSHDGGEK